ncbi:MAG: crossover junction endodeoxyribonuclease RuvC [Spirochaetales bacterium]|nr:crossover junction endodeoxyribonuclease RuvC [Spirochaetales bacterium]
MQNKTDRLVIGIDPGLASTGWGIVLAAGNRLTHLGHGVIETSSKLDHQTRLVRIYESLVEVLDTWKPQEAGMETLYFAKNVTSALSVAEARGVVTLALGLRGLPLGEYSPNEIKQAVSGSGRSDKKIVQESVRILLGLSWVTSPDHAADALAAAITRIHAVPLRY